MTTRINLVRRVGLVSGTEGPDEVLADGEQHVDGNALPTALCSADRLFDIRPEAVNYVAKPYAPRGEVIEAGGPHGHFKSTVMLYLCLSTATGRPWGGISVPQGRATFITLEDREAVIQARVLAYVAAIANSEERRRAEEDIRADFTYLAREQARALELTYTDGARRTAIVEDAVNRVRQLVEGRAIVSLETSARLHPGPEDHVGLAALATATERIAAVGPAVMVGRHHTKASAREGAADSYATSGAAVFSNAARSILSIEQDGRRKSKPGEEPPELDPFAPVRLRQVKAPPLAARGRELVWRPTLVELGPPLGQQMALVAVSEEEQLNEDGLKLLRHLHDAGEITKTELHKAPPCSLPRKRAKAAMERLKTEGKVRLVQAEGRGQTKQAAWVWKLA